MADTDGIEARLEAKRLAARAWRAAHGKCQDAEIVAGVRRYAEEHFNDGGWDVISEAWEDEQIVDAIGYADTVEGAIRKLRGVVSVYADRQADAINSAF